MSLLITCLLSLQSVGVHVDGVEQPNVVLIISDDQSWTDFSYMGHERICTPHLDELAEESLMFRRGYVPTALCRASLATFATGLYPHQHQITGNDPRPRDKDRDRMPLYADNLPQNHNGNLRRHYYVREFLSYQ